MSNQLSLNDFITKNKLKEERFDIPELDGWVIIREMTGEARDAYEQSLFTQNEEGEFERNLANARAKLISACVIGPDGKRMFKTQQHIEALGNMPGSLVDKLFEACQRINAISQSDMEEIAGN